MSSPALKKSNTEVPALAPAAAPKQAAEPISTPRKLPPIRRIVMIVLAVVALGFALKYAYQYITVGRFQISTDDAYVKADTSILSAKVAGLVMETPVRNNSAVKAGDVILRLDAKDYDLAVSAAKAKLATQQASLAVIAQQKIAQAAQISAAQAQVESARAVELNAALTQQRNSQMVKTNVGREDCPPPGGTAQYPVSQDRAARALRRS